MGQNLSGPMAKPLWDPPPIWSLLSERVYPLRCDRDPHICQEGDFIMFVLTASDLDLLYFGILINCGKGNFYQVVHPSHKCCMSLLLSVGSLVVSSF